MNYEKILKGVLSRAYKMDDGKIAEILKNGEENANEDEILSSLLSADTERVAQLKKQNADNKESFQQGYAKAKKEERQLFEKEIKEALEIESDTTGIDLITEIITERTKDAGKKGELTDDDVKKHPVYLNTEKSFKKQIADQKTEYENKLTELQTKAQRESTFSVVKENANAILDGLNPILSKNPKVAGTIRNQFLAELQGYDFEKQADGTWLVTKDGKVLEDGHGHSKSFEDIIKATAENYFDFQENNGGGNAGNQNDGGSGGSGGGTVPRFKNQAEADAYAVNDAIPLDQRIKALEEWTASTQ